MQSFFDRIRNLFKAKPGATPAPRFRNPRNMVASPKPQVTAPKPAEPAPATTTAQPKPQTTNNRERYLRVMWTVGSALSIITNVVLLIVVLVLVRELFTIKDLVGNDLVGQLYLNFVKMDQANITTDITVQDEIPIDFDLGISQETNVVLTQDTRINGARVTLATGGLNIVSAPTNIILPAGTVLPVRLEMTVPVQTRVPVNLNVPVDIPLDQTELHEPFVGLQDVVKPYYFLLRPEWQTWEDVPFCKNVRFVCGAIFK